MDAIAASRLLPSPFAPHFSPPTLRNSYLASNHRIRIQIFASKSPKFHRIFFPVRYGFGAFSSLEAHRNSRRYEQVVEDDEQVNTVGNCSEPEGNLLRFIAKQALLTLFFLAIGFAPLRAVRVSALAAPVATEEVLNKKQNGKGKEMSSKSHEYSECTRRLLETVSALTRRVEEVRKGNADLKQVEMELKAVKGQKEELQAEIMDSLYSELKELKRERGLLVKRSEGIVDRVVKTKKEYDKVLGDAGEKEDMDKVQMLEERLKELEEDYNSIWERVGEIEDQILRRETMALSFGVRELRFIERECEQLVENFSRQWRRKGLDRYDRLIF